MFVSWDALEKGRVQLVRRKKRPNRYGQVSGSPDWVLEIVSDSSVKKDLRDLRAAYHEANVDEYWIIDARGDEIEFQILHWRKSGYVAAPRKAGWQSSRVFGRGFRLTRMRDRRGGWRYGEQVGVRRVSNRPRNHHIDDRTSTPAVVMPRGHDFR